MKKIVNMSNMLRETTRKCAHPLSNKYMQYMCMWSLHVTRGTCRACGCHLLPWQPTYNSVATGTLKITCIPQSWVWRLPNFMRPHPYQSAFDLLICWHYAHCFLHPKICLQNLHRPTNITGQRSQQSSPNLLALLHFLHSACSVLIL